MATRGQLDPKYEAELVDMVGQFIHDPLGFARFAFDWGQGELATFKGPTRWQCEFLEEVGERSRANAFDGNTSVPPLRFATRSGHGIGKSALVGMLVNWIMTTRPHAKGVVTANTAPQLKTKTWAEIAKWTSRSICSHWWRVTLGSMQMEHTAYPSSWRCDAQTCREENSESFAGQHSVSSTSFYLFDESSAVPDVIHEVAQGGLTDGEPMFFAFGNPTRTQGWFADAFRTQSHRYVTRTIDSRDVEITNKALLQEWISDYGLDSDFVKVRVLGLPPAQAENQFIGRDIVEAAAKREVAVERFQPLVMGVDVARHGLNESVIRFRRGRDARSWPTERFQRNDLMQLADRIVELKHLYGVDVIFVDGGGVGGGVIDRLRQLRTKVVEVNFASKPSNKRYANKRAEMYGELKQALTDGLAIPNDASLADQICAIEYGYRIMDNAIQLAPKDLMDISPDDADALALTFAHPVAQRQGSEAHRGAGDLWSRQQQTTNQRIPGLTNPGPYVEPDYNPYSEAS